MVKAALFPDVRRGRRGQHRLDTNALVGELVLQRLSEGKDIGLARAVHAIEPLRHDADHRSDVDDRACAARNEGGGGGIGQARERRDVQRDHRFHLIDVRVHERREGGRTGVVDEHGDARVVAKHGLDLRKRRFVAEIGGDHFDGATRL